MQKISGKILARLGVSRSNVWYWRKIGLLPPKKKNTSKGYSFDELLAIKVVASLVAQGVRPARIKQALDAINQPLDDNQFGITNKKLFVRGKEIFVFQGGRAYEPRTGQYLLFETKDVQAVLIHEINNLKSDNESGLKKRVETKSRKTG